MPSRRKRHRDSYVSTSAAACTCVSMYTMYLVYMPCAYTYIICVTSIYIYIYICIMRARPKSYRISRVFRSAAHRTPTTASRDRCWRFRRTLSRNGYIIPVLYVSRRLDIRFWGSRPDSIVRADLHITADDKQETDIRSGVRYPSSSCVCIIYSACPQERSYTVQYI